MNEENRQIEAFDMNKLFKYVMIGIASFIFTSFAVIKGKELFSSNPLIAIIILVLISPVLVFMSKFSRRYLKIFIKKYSLIVLIPFILAIFLASSVSVVVMAVLFVLHAIMCIFLRRLKRFHIGVELITLIAVVGAFTFGPKTGAMMGAIAMLMDYIFSARLSMFTILTTVAYAGVGFAAGFMTGLNIIFVGVILAILYNLFTSFIIIGFMGGHIDKSLRFTVTDVAFNFIIFATVAPFLIRIMT